MMAALSLDSSVKLCLAVFVAPKNLPFSPVLLTYSPSRPRSSYSSSSIGSGLTLPPTVFGFQLAPGISSGGVPSIALLGIGWVLSMALT